MQRGPSIGIIYLLLVSAGGAWLNAQSWPDSNSGTLWVSGNERVTIPCGPLELAQDISRTYYVRDTGRILAHSLNEDLTINISLSDVNKHNICCLIDGITGQDPQEHCYHIKESYAPKRQPLNFQGPVFGQVFQMECPLEGSPPTHYYWKKYETIDMATETNFTADVHFSGGGRVWYVDVITAEHNGMYVCSAENEKGRGDYEDTTNFLISVSGCPYHAPDVSVHIIPTDDMNYYREKESVELACTAMAVEEHEQPFWWKEHDDGSMTLCTRPEYMLNNTFERSACRWTSTLTIPYFTSENVGKYHCTVGTNGDSRTLHLDDGSQIQNILSLVVLMVVTLVVVVIKPQLQCTEEPPSDGFMYDAFISAHDEARDFVLENLLPSLESGPSPYHLCWHSRDFLPGIPIVEQIVNTISKSRKIIFVFSENFCRSEFCRVELELAMNRYMTSSTRCILPVTMAGRHVPIYVRQTLTYLPILAAEEGDIAAKIAQVMGKPIPIMMERMNDSFVDEE